MNEFEEIRIDEIRKQIRTFNNDENTQRLENYYQSKSFPEIIGVSRKELAHSNFIAWLLNNKERHMLGDFSIKKFLEMLIFYCKEPILNKHRKLFDEIIISDYEILHNHIETEKSIKGVGRLDIYIELSIQFSSRIQKIKLIIENKVGTKEHSDQTTKYFQYYENNSSKSDVILYIFLTPISSLELLELEEPECSCKEYIQINYQSIVDYILEPAIKKNNSEKINYILKEYLQSLSQPTLNEDDEEYKQGLIMALGNDERELLTKFWDKNQNLILAALYAISSDPEQDIDTRDNATTAINNLSKNKKDRSLYSIKYENSYEVENIKKSDIGYSTVMILNSKEMIDEEVFLFLKTDKTCNFFLLKTIEEMTDTEIKYSKYRINSEPELFFHGKGYYIARNWGIKNTEKFIKKISTKFPKLEFELVS